MDPAAAAGAEDTMRFVDVSGAITIVFDLIGNLTSFCQERRHHGTHVLAVTHEQPGDGSPGELGVRRLVHSDTREHLGYVRVACQRGSLGGAARGQRLSETAVVERLPCNNSRVREDSSSSLAN